MRRQIFFHHDGIVANLAPRHAWNALKARAIAFLLDRVALRGALLARSRIDSELLLKNDQALRVFVRRHASPQSHDCGTCRMGPPDDPEAVVDITGRVHGVEALRVVDASIFPAIPRGYPHFIVIMTAEKVADAVAADWIGRVSSH